MSELDRLSLVYDEVGTIHTLAGDIERLRSTSDLHLRGASLDGCYDDDADMQKALRQAAIKVLQKRRELSARSLAQQGVKGIA